MYLQIRNFIDQEMNFMPINQVIREKRKELGFTQEQVADYLGVSAPAVNKWESGVSHS
jgi:transcriptional regulator with XRE-family HTH domain